MFHQKLLAASMIAALAIVGGCNRLSAENYARIKTGMSYEEVKGILGAPAECRDVQGMAKQCIWGDERKNVKVIFVMEKATVFTAENIK